MTEFWGVYYDRTNGLIEVCETHDKALKSAHTKEAELYKRGIQATYFVRSLTLIEIINYLLNKKG